MNGLILPGTVIAVDVFTIKARRENFVHFLTHLHGDHTVGLTSTWSKTIYCSEITALLLVNKFQLPSHLISVLYLNQETTVQLGRHGNMTVTALDANHCPGAVMFYFQGSFGRILYTGDFRVSEHLLQDCGYLSGKIDRLYIDNTFCNPKCNFPSREESMNEMVRIIKDHPNHDVYIGVYNLGKEDMLAKLSDIFSERINVLPQRYKICEILFPRDYLWETFTTSNMSLWSRIFAVPRYQINTKMIRERNTYSPTIAIIPTAIFTGCSKPYAHKNLIYVVPYSDHSSYPELMKFVAMLRPVVVYPIVNTSGGPSGEDFSDRIDMQCFTKFLSPKPVNSVAITGWDPSMACGVTYQAPNNVVTARMSVNYIVRRNARLRCKLRYQELERKRRKKGIYYTDEMSDDESSDSGQSMQQMAPSDHPSCGQSMQQMDPSDHPSCGQSMQQMAPSDHPSCGQSMQQMAPSDHTSCGQSMQQMAPSDHTSYGQSMQQMAPSDHTSYGQSMQQMAPSDHTSYGQSIQQMAPSDHPSCGQSMQQMAPSDHPSCGQSMQQMDPSDHPSCGQSMQQMAPSDHPSYGQSMQQMAPTDHPSCGQSMQQMDPSDHPSCGQSMQQMAPSEHTGQIMQQLDPSDHTSCSQSIQQIAPSDHTGQIMEQMALIIHTNVGQNIQQMACTDYIVID